MHVHVPEYYSDYQPCQAVSGLTSPRVAYLERKFVDGCEPSLLTIRRHLYLVPRADHCVAVLMAFLTLVFSPQELFIQYLSGHDAPVRVGACEFIFFLLPQHVHDFVSGTKMQ